MDALMAMRVSDLKQMIRDEKKRQHCPELRLSGKKAEIAARILEYQKATQKVVPTSKATTRKRKRGEPLFDAIMARPRVPARRKRRQKIAKTKKAAGKGRTRGRRRGRAEGEGEDEGG